MTLKTKWYYGCCDDFWRSVLQLNILKKNQTLNPYHFLIQEMYVTIMILEWLVSTLCMCLLTEIPEDKHNWVIIKSILRSFSYFECSTALWLLLCSQATKATHLQELAVCFRPRLSPDDAQNRVFAKSASCIQILDLGVVWVWSAAFFAVIISWRMPY